MKKITVIFAAVAVIASVMSHAQTYVRKDCEVVSTRNGIVAVEDTCGYTWLFAGDGYKVGDVVNVKMVTHGTDDPKDDSVVAVVD